MFLVEGLPVAEEMNAATSSIEIKLCRLFPSLTFHGEELNPELDLPLILVPHAWPAHTEWHSLIVRTA